MQRFEVTMLILMTRIRVLIHPTQLKYMTNHKYPDSTALVVEGGAMRSVFSAGVLDGFLSQKFNPFDLYIGVSGGAINLVTYLSGSIGKSLEIYKKVIFHSDFIDYSRFFTGGHLLDMDWAIEATTRDLKAEIAKISFERHPFFICMTEVNSGQAVYVQSTSENLLSLLKASSALPLVYRDFPHVNEQPMTDGGIADSIPVAKAIEMGAKKIVVIRARPESYLKKDTLMHRLIRWKLQQYKELHKTMQQRVMQHKETLLILRNPPEGVEVIEICPPESFTLGRFGRNRKRLELGYQLGLESALQVTEH
jgi:predicted patatin/cPLA2 family phospholipase